MELIDKLKFTCPSCSATAEYGLSITFIGWTTVEFSNVDPAGIYSPVLDQNLAVTKQELLGNEPIYAPNLASIVQDQAAKNTAQPRPPRKSTPRAATVQLETDIRTLLAFNPELTGQEIVAKTGAKQSTVYMILRKIKSENADELQPCSVCDAREARDCTCTVSVDDLVSGLVAV